MDTKERLLSALTSSFPEVARVKFSDRGGDRDVSIRVLQGLGTASSYLTPAKVRDLWKEYSKHDVLFSDYTMGKVEPFITAILNPRSIWFELFDLTTSKAIGIASLSEIIPHYDAKGHFAFWDKIGSRREPLVWQLMDICFDDFALHRMSAEAPAYQRGVIRAIKKLGFSQEGEKVEGVLYRGKWSNVLMFGITREEFRRIKDVGHPIRRGEVRNPKGNKTGDQERSGYAQSATSVGRDSRTSSEDGVSELDGSAGI